MVRGALVVDVYAVARCDSRQRRGLAAERVLGGKGRLMHRQVKPRRQLLISSLIVGAS